MTTPDNVRTIVDTARQTTEPRVVEPGKIYVVAEREGHAVVDLTGDTYRDQPRRKTGTVTVDHIESFLTYWGKHCDSDSEIYVDVGACRITAVLDAHTGDGPRWGEHRLVLQLRTADRWNEWIARDRKLQGQVTWAEFIEDHLDDFRQPTAADMLEIAQTFEAATKVRFTSSTRLSSGNRRLQWEETTDAKAGEAGNLQVPSEFEIALAPFDFCEKAYVISARFRYRIENAKLHVCYLLNNAEDMVRDAVLDVVKKIEDETKTQVMRGIPAR